MSKLKSNETFSDPKDYTLTRGEFAKTLGISTNTLKQRMRRGSHIGDYIVRENQYFFRKPLQTEETKRDFKEDTRIQSLIKVPKKVKRGNHYKANYPNEAFRLHNLKKMLAKVNETNPEFIKEYETLRKEYQEKTQREKQKVISETQVKSVVNRGVYPVQNTYVGTHRTPWVEPLGRTKDEYELAEEDFKKNQSKTWGKYY